MTTVLVSFGCGAVSGVGGMLVTATVIWKNRGRLVARAAARAARSTWNDTDYRTPED